jgi:hypothetical protein
MKEVGTETEKPPDTNYFQRTKSTTFLCPGKGPEDLKILPTSFEKSMVFFRNVHPHMGIREPRITAPFLPGNDLQMSSRDYRQHCF